MLDPVQATMEGLDSSGNIIGKCWYNIRQTPAICSDRAFAVKGRPLGEEAIGENAVVTSMLF